MKLNGSSNHNLNGETSTLLRPAAGGKSSDSLMYSVCTPQQDINNNDSLLILGSTGNDHLANERTYVGWIFFSVFMIGVSITMLKGENRNVTTQVDGYLSGLVGLVALIASTDRYFRIMKMIEEGNNIEPNVNHILFVVVIIFASVGIAFAFCFMERGDSI